MFQSDFVMFMIAKEILILPSVYTSAHTAYNELLAIGYAMRSVGEIFLTGQALV